MIPTLKSVIVSAEMIKSICPSKEHPKIHKLSFFDQICSRIYIPFVFFYPNSRNQTDEIRHQSVQLKESLSEALSQYYPLAGRFIDDLTIDCNNEGIEFNEACFDSDLSGFLMNPKDETMKILFPEKLQYKDPLSSSTLVVQVTYFNCGGMALAICISHKVMDIAGISYFINNWAAMARKSNKKFCPNFKIVESRYPSIELPAMETYEPDKVKSVSRRIVFEGSTIEKLKSMVGHKVSNPTRFEVVTSVLYKSAIEATREFSGLLKPSIIHIGSNLRDRVIPSLDESAEGNFSGTFPVTTLEDGEIELERLTDEIKRAKIEYWNNCAKKLGGEELCSYILEASVGLRHGHGRDEEGFLCSSFCRYPLYKADFGWGRPSWVSVASCEVKNVMMLMDTSDGGGIEAYVSLQEQVMDIFEHNHFLLSFASINPSVIP